MQFCPLQHPVASSGKEDIWHQRTMHQVDVFIIFCCCIVMHFVSKIFLAKGYESTNVNIVCCSDTTSHLLFHNL